MSINKYPSNAAIASVAISTGISGNGSNADQADINATDATAFVISTNVNMPVGMYTVSGVNGSAKSKTAISQVASSTNNGIYISTGTTQFYAYVPAQWTTRPLAFSTTSAIVAMGYGNGKYIATLNASSVGFGRWSTNAITWATTTTTFDGTNSIRYLNNLWLAGAAGSRNIFTSTDGLTWTSRTNPSGSAQIGFDFAYGNSVYVAVAGNGSGALTNVVSSTDGTTWTTRTTLIWASSSQIGGILYGTGGFVAINNSYTTSVYVSTDAITWTTRTVPYTPTSIASGNWQASIYANGIYMLVDTYGSTVTSTDAITWTVKNTTYPGTNSIRSTTLQSGIAYNNGAFVVSGNDNSSRGWVWVSSDGSNWTVKNPGGFITGFGIVYGEKWVFYGGFGGAANTVTNHCTSADPSGLTTQSAGIIWERKGNPNGVF